MLRKSNKKGRLFLLTVMLVIFVVAVLSYAVCCYTIKAEIHVRNMGLMNIAAEKVAKTIKGMEMNAVNVFDEVSKHLDTPESVIAAMESKASLNPDVRGYFAAFEPYYFPQKGRWFEPYVHQTDSAVYEMSQVGSARHDYTKSGWYIRAKELNTSFWSDPYYYYDGTSISGHYCTFVKPMYNAQGTLVCVCGADITFEWLTKELQRIDRDSKMSDLHGKYGLFVSEDFYTVILDVDGSSIAYPEGKRVLTTDARVLQDLREHRIGMFDTTVNGVAATVYYGPILPLGWTAAVVVPCSDIARPLWMVGGGMLVLMLAGMLVIWMVYRKMTDEQEDVG